MKRERPTLYCFTLLLLTTVGSVWAFADTPGTCTNKHGDCTYQCPTDGSKCQITVQRTTSGSVTLVASDGTPATIFCARPGTPIQWILADATSFADIQFASGSSPFPRSSVFADSSNQANTTIGSWATGCYTFSIADCPLSSGGTCGYSDPKVVIHPPTLVRRRHKKTSPKPQQ